MDATGLSFYLVRLFYFLTFSLNDLPVIGLLLIALAAYFIGYAAASTVTDAIILLAGVTLGRGMRFALKADGKWQMADGGNNPEIVNRKSAIVNFIVGLVVLLAFSACWHLDMVGAYHGPRWMGFWDNPNIYGMLMGAGLTLAVGILVGERTRSACGQRSPVAGISRARRGARRTAAGAAALPIILFIAAGMMTVGLFFSYSRGAWVGTATGLLYLAKAHGKFKWKYILPGIFVMTAVVLFFWNATPDNAPWYIKRMDFGRPSAQHRVAAWRGAFQMMRDHPLGVGWNKAVETYEKNYSPPEGGAAALTMNSYLMLGTELGSPGLFCFVTYVALQLGVGDGRKKTGIVSFTSPLPAPRVERE